MDTPQQEERPDTTIDEWLGWYRDFYPELTEEALEEIRPQLVKALAWVGASQRGAGGMTKSEEIRRQLIDDLYGWLSRYRDIYTELTLEDVMLIYAETLVVKNGAQDLYERRKRTP